MSEAKERMTNLLKAKGMDTEGNDVELVKKTIGYVFADEDFTSKESFNWYIPGGEATTSSESSEGGEEVSPTGGQDPVSPTGTTGPTGGQDPVSPTGTTGPTGGENPVSPTGGEDPVSPTGGEDPGQSEIEVKEESNAWTYVYNESTFNTAMNGGLGKYYENHPDEDLESINGAGNATFNDRIYVGSLDDSNEVKEFKAGWEETSQKITNVADSTEVYYMERLDNQGNQYEQFQGESWILYTDAALTTEAGHVFHITRLEFDGFEHTYNAAVNAPGSTLPWIVVNFDGETNNTVEFEYDGTSIPLDGTINYAVIPTSTFATEFDETKLKMYISK